MAEVKTDFPRGCEVGLKANISKILDQGGLYSNLVREAYVNFF